LKRKLGGWKERKSEQVWVRRPPMLGVRPSIEPPLYFVSFEEVEETSTELGVMELVDDVWQRKTFSIIGLERMYGKERMRELLTSLYQHFSITQIADLLSRPHPTIHRWLRRYEIPLRPPIKEYHIFKVVPERIWVRLYPRRFMYEEHPIAEYTLLPSKDLAYLFGLTFAEGTAYAGGVRLKGAKQPNPYGWKLGDAIYELAEKTADELMIDEKKPTVSRYYLYEMRHVTREKANFWSVHIFSSTLSHTFGFPRWRECLLETMMKPAFFPPFTAGFWDGDGAFTYKKRKPESIILSQEVSKQWLLDRVVKCLREYGIKVSLHGPYKMRTSWVCDEEVYEMEYLMFEVYIRRESWADFIRMIGPYQRNPLHKERAKEFLEFIKKERGAK